MKTMQRWISALLAICMIVVMIPVTVSAASSGTCGENLTWTLSDDGVLTIAGTGPMSDYGAYVYDEEYDYTYFDYHEYEAPWYKHMGSINAIVIEEGITSIGQCAFYDLYYAKSVVIPDTVTSIGYQAFAYTGLRSVTIPANVTAMGTEVFSCCNNLQTAVILAEIDVLPNNTFCSCISLTTVTLPEGITTIGDSAFSQCSALSDVQIPDSVTTLNGWAFYGCNALTQVTIPANVSYLGGYVFNKSNLTEITFLGDAPAFDPYTFSNVTATAYYPGSNPTWTSDVMQNYNGAITWVAFEPEDENNSGTCGDNLTWTLSDEGVLTISGTGAMENYKLMDNGSSTAPWADHSSSVKRVIIENGVTSIGDHAFTRCYALMHVTIEDSVTSIGKSAFSRCSALNNVTIPDSVTSIGNFAFAFCSSLTDVAIGSSVTAISDYTFLDCVSLQDVTIPDSVTSIGEEAFYNCKSLNNVTIGNGVLYICTSAFQNCISLTSLIIGSSVKSIGESAFQGCNSLTSLTIPDSVKSISTYAFADCTALTEITFCGDAPDIEAYAFKSVTATAHYPPHNATWVSSVKGNYSGKITWVTVENGGYCGDNAMWFLLDNGDLVITGSGPMDNYTNYRTAPWYDPLSVYRIKRVVIKTGVTSIGDHAFTGCTHLSRVTIPDSVTSIGEDAFPRSRLTGIYVDENNPCYSSDSYGVLFNKDKTELIQMPNRYQGHYSIPDTVATTANHAFYGCSGLTSVTIPDSVTSISYCAFTNCEGLTQINVDENNPCYSSDSHGVLFNKIKTELIQMPCGYEGHYSIPNTVTAIGGYAFASCLTLSGVTIPSSVTSIGEYAFKYCHDLTSVTIGSGITSIDDYAFYCCNHLTNVTFNNSPASIGKAAFAECDDLTTVNFGNGITSIGNNAFEDCIVLTSVTIPDSVTSIGDYAFRYCAAMSSLTIGNGVKTIGEAAFVECNALTSVTIPDSVTSIGDYAFSHCFVLEEIVIPDNVATIGNYAFEECDLRTVTIGNGVKTIGDYAFQGNGNLGTVTLGNSVTTIGNGAFYNCGLGYIEIPASVTSIGAEAFSYCMYLGKIIFHGNAPTIGANVFERAIHATAYYPPDNATWTSDVMQSYGGTVTWQPYEEEKEDEEVQPEAPTIKASNIASSGKIKVTWDKVEGAVKYKVYRATSKTGTYKLMKTVTGTSFTNTSVDAGKTYYYYVRAVDVDGKTSDKSNIVSRTCDLARPELTMSNVASSGKIKVSWKAIDGAVEYEVYRATSKDGTYKLVKTTTGTSFTNTSTTAGKTYYYKVKAIASKSAADSAYSEVKSRTCDLARPTASVALSSNKPKVSWKKVDGAVEYEVYRATSKSGTYSKVKTTTSLSYKDTKATSGKTYYYKVIAVASKSAANSAYSSVVSIKSK